MKQYPLFNHYPEIKELIQIFRHEVQKAQRSANEIILTDNDVQDLLKISKRKLQYMKANLVIPFSRPEPYNSTYYLLSDILKWINNNRQESTEKQRRF